MNSNFPIKVLPYPRNQHFFGRAAELQQLSDLLDHSNTASTSREPRTVLLRGMGGVGKTQVALEYANITTHYDAIFWLRCETMVALEESCRQVVQELGLATDPESSVQKTTLLKRWLANTDRQCLLILDDLDEPERTFLEIFPLKLNNGSVIATSRRNDGLDFQFASTLEVLPFEPEEGSKFLLHLLNRNNSLSNEATNAQADASLNLSERLGGLPLAIAQMGIMIRQRKMSVTSFLSFYEKYHEKIDRKQGRLTSTQYSYNLGSVWLLSFKTLSHGSYRLLGIISHLAPDSIPAALLCEDTSKVFEFDDAIFELVAGSLIRKHSKHSEMDIFSVHRLVQQAFRDYLSEQERSVAFDDTTKLIFNAIQDKYFGNATPSEETFKILRPHIDHLKALPEAQTSVTFDSLLSYTNKLEAYSPDDNQSTSSTDSIQDGAFSNLDSISSRSSVLAEERSSAISLLVEIFRKDIDLVASCSRLLSNANEDKFHREFGDLLTLFSKDLLADPVCKIKPHSANWIESRRYLISQNLVTYLKPPSGNSLTTLPPCQEKSSLVIERYLEQLDPVVESDEPPVSLPTTENATFYHSDDIWHAGDDDDHDFEEWTEHLKTLVSKSSAFEKLKTNLSRMSKPYRCNMSGCGKNVGFSTMSELAHHKGSKHKTLSGLSRIGNIDDKLRIVIGFVHFWTAYLRSIFRTSLMATIQSREEPCPANMVRGQWICACGYGIVDDFYESVPGSVASAMRELSANRNSESYATNAVPSIITREALSSLYDRIGVLATFVLKITTRLRRKIGLSGRKDRVDSSDAHELGELPTANSLTPRFLLLCITTWRGYDFTQMVPVDLNVASDEILFCELKKAYHRRAGTLKRLLSLFCIQDIRFVRFIITRNKLVDIDLHSRVEGRILETIPPVNHGDYSYDPKPIRHEPPVGHRTMMHRYCCPKACDLSHCLKRFPGYCQEQVRIQDDADDEIAWGIELVEGADLAYAWVFMLLIMGSSITFGIGWAVVRKDLSGGFAVSAVLLATFTCLLGTMQATLRTL